MIDSVPVSLSAKTDAAVVDDDDGVSLVLAAAAAPLTSHGVGERS